MSKYHLSVSGQTIVNTARTFVLSGEHDRALVMLLQGLVGDGTNEIAPKILTGELTLVNDHRDVVTLVEEDSKVRAAYEEKLRYVYAGRTCIDGHWWRPVARVAGMRHLDAPVDVHKWCRLVTGSAVKKHEWEIEVEPGDCVIFERTERPPSWLPSCSTPLEAVTAFEAVRDLALRAHRHSHADHVKEQLANVAKGDRRGIRDLADAMQDWLYELEDREEAAFAASIGAKIREKAGDDVFDMTLLDGSVVKVPRAPFEQWALQRTALAHLAAPWEPVAHSGMKMQNDNPFHTDWVLGAGLVLKDSYAPHDKSPYLDPSYEAAHELQQRLGNYAAHVIVDAGSVNGIVGKAIAVVPNLGVEHAGVLAYAKGIITERGGELAHLAIVGREQGITIMRVPDAMTRYPEGVAVYLTPSKGEVHAATYKPTGEY